jgi:hypothetical protein
MDTKIPSVRRHNFFILKGNNYMKLKFALLISLLVLFVGTSTAQQNGNSTNKDSSNKTDDKNKNEGNKSAVKAVNITPATKPDELAKIVVDVLGGDKFKNMKTLIVGGSVNLYPPNSTQSLPGSFAITTSGIKYRMEVKSLQSFSMIYNGEQMYSSIPGFSIPSPSKFGLPLLQHLNEPGYSVEGLPDKKNARAFVVTDPEGNKTKFYIDTKTGRIKSYEIPLDNLTYGSEIDEYKEYDGVLVPTKFVQRLDTQMGAFFAEFKAKDVKVNAEVLDKVFDFPTGKN